MRTFNLNKHMLYLILFMGVFNFYIPGIGPALYIAFVLTIIYILLNIKQVSNAWGLISKTYVDFIIKYCLPLALIIMLVILKAILMGAEDVSYLSVLMKILSFSLVASLFPICICTTERIDALSDFNKYIYKITLLQSLIIIVAILYPPFAEIVRTLQNNDSNNSSLVSEGLRGVALSSMQYYALACYFCFVLILLANDFTKKKITLTFTCIMLLFITAASIFVSRTAILGVGLFFVYIFNPLASFSKARSINLLMIFLCLGVLALLISYLLFPEQLLVIQEKVLPWAFEMIYRYNDTGSVSTASTDELKNMYFTLQEHTLLFGDGRYAGDIDGTYYMGTDAGYMRPTLYGGIVLMLSMLIVWFYWLKKICDIEKSHSLFFALILLSLALQYKGEFIITNYCTSILLVVLMMTSLLLKNKKSEL
ncbi:TPA: hypothetical protein KUN31_003603 [Enterobacter cloacae]|uniref:hypothetical protein n=1 Tax=Enterobacter cloacae TaxID=550 RepID=UPI001C3B1768|nr:hypothetical protein [Enterobacter cloacae]HEI9733508.1 hypothetical protein [Enterobacter cloacae]